MFIGIGLTLLGQRPEAAPPDITAPTLSSPTDAADGSDGAALAVTTDEAGGTLYWFVSTSATPPSAADLKAGTGAVAYGDQTVSGTGVQNVAIASGLTAETDYYSYFLHRDAAGNDSSIAAADGFTTAADSGLSAPGYTNTAAAGDPPAGEIAFNADHEPGHYLRIIRSADGVTEPDGTYTTTTMTVDYQLQFDDFTDGVSAAELAAEGYLDPTGAWYQKAGIFAEGGTVENWSAEISGTVTASVATWATSDGVNKHSGLSLEDGNLTLVAEGNGGSTAARASIVASADDTYFEITVKAFDSDTTGGVRFGVVNSSRALTSTGNIGGSGLADQGVTFRLEPDTANLQVWANGALQSSTALGANPTAGAKAGIRIRKSINTIDVYYAANGAGMSASPIRTIVMSSPPDAYYAMGCCERGEATLTDCDKLTANFGGTAFHGTNPAAAIYG